MSADEWCQCVIELLPSPVAPSWEDHPEPCGWPEMRCDNDDHGRVRHEGESGCGLPIAVLFCRCTGELTWAQDSERGWWVHDLCGWPTEEAYENLTKAPDHLLGVTPRIARIHVKRPSRPKGRYAALTIDQRERDVAWHGRIVRG